MALIINENLTADGNTSEYPLNNANNNQPPYYSVFIYGTFGSGTVTLQVSPDGGTTWIDVLDQSGSAVAATANLAQLILLPSCGNNPIDGQQTKLRGVLAGSTNPDINFRVGDVK